ncbi:MAG: type II secretion system protein GspN [Myxococcota bacterium]
MAGVPAATLPRWLRVIGIPAAGLLLVLGFIYRGFPYDRLAEFIEAKVRRDTPILLVIRDLGPRLTAGGPGVEARGVRARGPGTLDLTLDTLRLRPAWSLSWFRGAPAIRTELAGPLGEADGTVTLNGSGVWVGELRRIDLAALPLESLWPGLALEGSADAAIDLRLGESGPEGTISFEAQNGSVKLPGLPVAVPFEQLIGDLLLGGEAIVTVNSLELHGPLISGELTGTVGHAREIESAPLSMSAILRTGGASSLLESAGLRVSRDGTARMRITGTVANPQLQ